MPVTVIPAPLKANAWPSPSGTNAGINTPAVGPRDVLRGACTKEYEKTGRMINSSFRNLNEEKVYASRNGFVNSAYHAYNNHYHLIIRPEDVWFSILTQVTLYINKNAELLRDKFVAHSGKKELLIMDDIPFDKVDHARLAWDFSKLIQDKVIDPDLRTWIMPAFTTTTKEDEVVASVIMMGAMSKYFSFEYVEMCGIPSVTLLGVRSDWKKILGRLEKLLTFGEEAIRWYNELKPVLKRFLLSFDKPDSVETKDFWKRVVHRQGGSGPTQISGWITAFCFWDDEGVCLRHEIFSQYPIILAQMLREMLHLDGVPYHEIEEDKIPPAYASVEIKVFPLQGPHYYCMMAAGIVGINVLSSREAKKAVQWTFKKDPVLDTIQPKSGWFIHRKKGDETGDKREFGVKEDVKGLIKAKADVTPDSLALLKARENNKNLQEATAEADQHENEWPSIKDGFPSVYDMKNGGESSVLTVKPKRQSSKAEKQNPSKLQKRPSVKYIQQEAEQRRQS